VLRSKCGAERICTFNLADFRKMVYPDLQDKLCTP
jgi:hypothetical protein